MIKAVAEAILAAMDADLKSHDAKPGDDYDRRHIEDSYFLPLVQLEDKRIVGELARRSKTADTVRMRRKWAYAAHWLGDPQPLKSFADDFRAGKIRLPANNLHQTNDKDQPGNVELLAIIGYLASTATPEADRTLYALADRQHPYYQMTAECVLKSRVDGSDDTTWFAHPYCLAILRRELDNTRPTGSTYKIEKDRLVQQYDRGSSSGGIPEFLADPAARRDQASERACDEAAEKLTKLVIGLPLYHPLFKDADKRLKALKTAFDRFAGRYRRANWREHDRLSFSPWTPAYLPDIRSLGRAATAEDVRAGKAIFHLDGKGKPTGLKLPAVAVLKRDAKKQRPVLIVQAEAGADGQVTYGVIMREDIRAVPEGELTGIKTFAELDTEEKKAAEKQKDKKD